MIKPQVNLESTNIWDHKPGWCQPWSIILTGLLAIVGSWLILHILWITIGVSLLMSIWWIYFLGVYPKAFAEYISSQQDKARPNT